MAESVGGMGRLVALLLALAARVRSPREALEEAGGEMVASIRRTFDAGGRPRWAPLSTATRARGGSILNRSGDLRSSFEPRVRGRTVSAESNVVYGPRQHFGYDPGGKTGPGQVRTPARSFAFVADEDVGLVVGPVWRLIAGG